MLSKKPGQGHVSFGPVAHLARRHEIPARSIAAFDPRLHMVRRQLLNRKDLPTVHATIPVARKDLLTRQGKLPLDAAVCRPRTFTFAPCVSRD